MNPKDQDLIGNARKIYFVGIGGVGMSGLAQVLKHQGYEVCGSDAAESRQTQALRKAGIRVFTELSPAVVADSDLLIYSSAIAPHHPELETARRYGVKIYHRAQILSSLLNQANTAIGVTGTHGKTTTSSMISFVLCELRKNPTCLIGGDLLNFESNAVLGNNDLWVAEVDESDKTHELYALNYAVITNLEQDHIENYHTNEDLKDSFERFLAGLGDPGLVVYSGDDAMSREVIQTTAKPRVSFGFSPEYDYSADHILMTPFGSEFDLSEVGFFVTRVKLSVPGKHNIANALACIAVLTQMGLDVYDVCRALYGFRGARRRLELKADCGNCVVVDDYAHHPTEVLASLRALQSMGKRVVMIFQPHRYTRTAYFFKEFAAALSEADQVILTDIYPAGEKNPGNVDSRMIYDELIKLGHGDVSVIERDKIINKLYGMRELGGVIAFVGAGNIGGVADEFASRLKDLATA